MKYLYGEVVSVDTKTFAIRFKINGILDNSQKYPQALPKGYNLREIKVGDIVLIEQVDLSHPVFYYYPQDNDNFIGIRYGDSEINIDVDTQDISIKGHKVTITITKQGLEIKGDPSIIVHGTPTISTPGGFCALSHCTFTGVVHTTNKLV